VIELWAVEAFVLRLLLLVLRKQLLCAFLSLIFLCGMMPFCAWCVAYVGDAYLPLLFQLKCIFYKSNHATQNDIFSFCAFCTMFRMSQQVSCNSCTYDNKF
jgi:hypothetical protein